MEGGGVQFPGMVTIHLQPFLQYVKLALSIVTEREFGFLIQLPEENLAKKPGMRKVV